MQTMTFANQTTRVRDLIPTIVQKGNKNVVKTITVDGREMTPTPRFWGSFFSRFGFGPSTFKLFDHAEVFERISNRMPDDKLRLTIESGAADKLLAISNPKKPIIHHDELLGLLAKQGLDTDHVDYGAAHKQVRLPVNLRPGDLSARDIITSSNPGDSGGRAVTGETNLATISYDTGVIRSFHTPRNNGGDFNIAGDSFLNRFVMDTPIDGYGKPSIYLMLLREICTNGAIGYARAFRSDINTGKGEDNFEYALTRAFEGYNNEEGFQCIRSRFESAAKSWASINEVNKAYKTLVKCHHRAEMRVDEKYLTSDRSGSDGAALMDGSPVLKSFNRLVGDLTKTYGLANLEALGAKRQRVLPAGVTCYDLINFMTETATHHATPAGARSLQAYVGDALSQELDLELSKEKFGEWADFFISDKQAIDAYAELQKA